MNSVVGNCDSCDVQLWSDGRAGRHGKHGVHGTLCGPCHRDAETSELKRDVERITRERDDAQMAVCDRAVFGRPGHESSDDFGTLKEAAEYFGWPHLYSEERS